MKRSLAPGARDAVSPAQGLPLDTRLRMDGRDLLARLPDGAAPAAFLDPQYRGVLDKLAYGNEGRSRGRRRAALQQMDEGVIVAFLRELDRVLLPGGHLFLWLDKYHLCTGVTAWLAGTGLAVVDLVTWDKGRMGMGYRTRRQAEYLLVLQKAPRRAKGRWTRHDIPDVWHERAERGEHAHRKPVALQGALIEAVTAAGELVIDPAAGSFSVLEACRQQGRRFRRFLGCDIEG